LPEYPRPAAERRLPVTLADVTRAQAVVKRGALHTPLVMGRFSMNHLPERWKFSRQPELASFTPLTTQ
jgi:hypothetical protein